MSREVRELKSLGGVPGPWHQETRTDLRTAGTFHSRPPLRFCFKGQPRSQKDL